jgi:NitT/TauT family transport system substrate-binding protein
MRLGIAATVFTLTAAAITTTATAAEPVKLRLAMSGWTGFAPITLAKQLGFFEKHGIDLDIIKMPTTNRHQAMASGDVQVITTTVDTHLLYASSGVPVVQVLALDTSSGGDGIATRKDVASVEALKGKSIAVQFGSDSQFWLAYLLKQHGLTMQDVKLTDLQPADAAAAFVAGQFDVAVTYEPYLSNIRKDPDGKILVTSADTPGVIIDTLAFQPDYVAAHPDVVQGVVDSWFDALAYIKAHPDDANKIMGADVDQTAQQFADSAQYVTWYDRAANKAYLTDTMPSFIKLAADVMLEAGLLRRKPDDLTALYSAKFVQ